MEVEVVTLKISRRTVKNAKQVACLFLIAFFVAFFICSCKLYKLSVTSPSLYQRNVQSLGSMGKPLVISMTSLGRTADKVSKTLSYEHKSRPSKKKYDIFDEISKSNRRSYKK